MQGGRESDDKRAAIAAALVAGLLIAQQVAGKATRDALLLSSYGASIVPKMMMAGAGASLCAVLVTSWALQRWGPTRVVPAAAATSAAVLLGLWVLAVRVPAAAAIALYVHMAVFGATLISSFWSLVNERFDPHTAKRFVGRIAAGGTAGGIVGGVIALQVSHALTVQTTIAVMAGMHGLCVWGVLPMRPSVAHAREPVPATKPGARPPAAFEIMRAVPYLRHLAALVVVVSATDSVFDYLVNRTAESAFHDDSASLVSFFVAFHVGTAVLAFLVQTLLSRFVLERLGLASTVALLPAGAAIGSLAIALGGGPIAIVAVRGLTATLANSLFRSAYEVLYTPLAPEQKRPTKTLVDVGFDRLGTIIGGGLTLLAITIAPLSATLGLSIGAAVVCAITVFLARRLHRGYVESLATSLRSGALRLDASDVTDATTRRTLAETLAGLDRATVLREIEKMRGVAGPTQGESLASESTERVALAVVVPADGARRSVGPAPPRKEFEALVADFRSGDLERQREALEEATPLTPELVGHLLPLLAVDGIALDVLRALRKVVPRVTGQLVDALLDPARDEAVRRRVPKALRISATQRVADGLMLGLRDERFEVRYECALALAKITGMEPSLRIPRPELIRIVKREVEVGRRAWEARLQRDALDDDADVPVFSTLHPQRADRSLEHVFSLLSLVLDREPLTIARRALALEDPALRGTALEYLENVLPEEVRDGLWPYLDDKRAKRRPPRPSEQVLGELLKSVDQIPIPKELRAKPGGRQT